MRPPNQGRVRSSVVGIRVRRVLRKVPGELGGNGEQIVVAGRLRMIRGAQGPVPVTQQAGPVAEEAVGESLEVHQRHVVTCRVKGSKSGVLDPDQLAEREKRAPASR
jgi:hypothetical protein